MRKWFLQACWGCLAGGLILGVAFSQGADMVIDISISPATLVLHSTGKWVTVHADIPFNVVERSTLALSGIPVASAKADAQGNLVAKFRQSEVKEIVAPPQATLTLTGETTDGTPFTGSDTIKVRK